MRNLLSHALTENHYSFSETVQSQLIVYLELLQKWNRIFNLTAIHDPREMVYLHILDSLSISPYLQGEKIIDVGTGAGLPGIPLALTHPQKQFVLLDSNGKKTRFLTQVIAELAIKNVEVIHARCQDFHPSYYFDSIISRAFSRIADMLNQTQHLANENSHFLAMKGKYPREEIELLPTEFELIHAYPLTIKGVSLERYLLVIRMQSSQNLCNSLT